jgi:hypothetical protein
MPTKFSTLIAVTTRNLSKFPVRFISDFTADATT